MSVSPGSRFGRYRVIRELGRGGEAIVHLAEDDVLKRPVALKIFPLAIAAGDSAGPPRFRNEVEILSRLDHPGICRIHDAGIEDGFAFIAMSYVEGTTLDALTGLGEGDAIALVEDAARIVASSHAAGVVHGDLKPQNILVSRSGSCVVLDFGVSRFLDETRGDDSGPGAGTLPYLAPECLSHPSHPRADVYALGAVLFELVTHRTPFVAPTKAAFVKKILLEDPPLCRSIAPGVSRDLEAILAKALRRDPRERYATMAEFADDLGRLRSGQPVSVARFGPLRRAARWANRRPALAALIVFVLVFLGSAVSIAVVKNQALGRYLERAGFEAHRSFAEAEAAERHLERYARLADDRRLEDLRGWAGRLVPPKPDLIPELRSWMASAEALVGRLPDHRSALAALRTRGVKKAVGLLGPEVSGTARREIEALQRRRPRLAAAAEGGPDGESRRRAAVVLGDLDTHLATLAENLPRFDEWTYDSAADAWQDATLSSLIRDLESFSGSDPAPGTMQDVARRIPEAERVGEALTRNRATWAEAIRAIGDRQKSPRYGGLVLEPQPGLIPLRQNPETGLWEFVHVLSAEDQPGVAPEDTTAMSRTGIVLVLLPGGVVRMGARRPRPGERADAPHLDPDAAPKEFPLDEVHLDPFFLSKFEMTESQWRRVRGVDHGEDVTWDLPPSTTPVVSIDWYQTTLTLTRTGLALPTEAQWEYGARGGTTTPWWTGATPETLRGAEVFAMKRIYAIGTLRPNPFGLFDVAGNATEWCADGFERYSSPTLSGTGERSSLEDVELRVHRGGSYRSIPTELRSARRNMEPPTSRHRDSGVRPARPLDR